MNLEGFHFCPKIHPIFGVQPFWAQFKPREFWNKGSFIQNLFLFLEFQKSEVFQNRGNFTLGEFQTSPWNCLYSRSWVRWREFHPDPPHAFTIFGNPKIWTIPEPRESKVEGVSFLSLKLRVYRELRRFHGELQTEIPAVIGFQKSGLFSSWEFHFYPKIHPISPIPKFGTILKPREFYSRGVSNLSVKLFVLKELSQMGGVSSRPPPRLHDFWNSRNREYFRTAGMSSRGSFKPLGETLSSQGAESLSRRVTDWNFPAVLPIPKFWTISKPRKFETQGVSFLSKISSYFWNSKNRS